MGSACDGSRAGCGCRCWRTPSDTRSNSRRLGRRGRRLQDRTGGDRKDDPRQSAASDVVGGHAALSAAINVLIDSWEGLASDRKNNAERLFYGYPREKALLHDPLDPLLASLDPEFRRFTAGRWMRDGEHAAALRLTQPHGPFLTSHVR